VVLGTDLAAAAVAHRGVINELGPKLMQALGVGKDLVVQLQAGGWQGNQGCMRFQSAAFNLHAGSMASSWVCHTVCNAQWGQGVT
jgi:hypothetical protein